MEVLPKRFGKYGLTLHPDKTRLVPFRRPSCKTSDTKGDDNDRSGTFDLLGFTHYWGRNAAGRMGGDAEDGLEAAEPRGAKHRQWCRANRHLPIVEQYAKLSQKGADITRTMESRATGAMLHWFLWAVSRAWRKWLDRRNRRR